MNSDIFVNLLKNPEDVNALNTQQLDDVIAQFPYFQAARAIQLKGLHKTNSYNYNQALKKTASYTIDRRVLFDFITSQNFTKSPFKQIEELEDIEVIEPIIIEKETIQNLHQKITDTHSLEVINNESERNLAPEIEPIEPLIYDEKDKETEILEIGKPLEFNSTEPHSFNEWMQLVSKKPIDRTEKVDENLKKPTEIKNKFSLIDKFIQTNPKIKPVDKQAVNIDVSLESSSQNESLMTETLAKVYLEQKKYENAIKAYRILSLKYPEKSSFFANRIKAIKILQKNKS